MAMEYIAAHHEKEEKMNTYPRSICATCIHAPYCLLTTDRSSISSCSEYFHHLDKDYTVVLMESLEMTSAFAKESGKKERL